MIALHQPTNMAEFQKMMEIVDLNLRERDVPPDARPMNGWLEISRSLKLGLRMFPDQKTVSAEGRFDGDDMTIRILQWFDERYGENLKLAFGPGRVFFLIRHDPWIVNLPRIYGSAVLFASSTERSSQPEQYLRRREQPRVNVIESIENMTESMKASLTANEQRAILVHWTLSFDALSFLEAIGGTPMVAEAQSDIEAAVQHAMANPPHWGQSKWSSLQATEKTIKIFLSLRQKIFPFSHELKKLAGLAEAAGLPPIDRSLLTEIKCVPAIRYGEVPTTAFQALGAHVAALKVIRHVGIYVH